MSDVLRKHLDGIDATIALLTAQSIALRHALPPVLQAAQMVPQERLGRCADVPDERCARVSEDAVQARPSFSAPHAWRCVGCGHEET